MRLEHRKFVIYAQVWRYTYKLMSLFGVFQQAGTCSMSTEANKVLVRRYREVHNTNNLALLDAVVAADIKSNNCTPGSPPGLEGGEAVHRTFLSPFPELPDST